MSAQDVELYAEKMNGIVERHLKGLKPWEIANETGYKSSEIVRIINDWKHAAANSDVVRIRAREALAGADQHFTDLIKQAYELNDDAKTGQSLAQRTAALKLVLDIEKSRIDMLQKAGLLENRELAEQLVENEKKQAAIMEIIKEVISTCNHCKPKVLKRMSQMNGEAVIING